MPHYNIILEVVICLLVYLELIGADTIGVKTISLKVHLLLVGKWPREHNISFCIVQVAIMIQLQAVVFPLHYIQLDGSAAARLADGAKYNRLNVWDEVISWLKIELAQYVKVVDCPQLAVIILVALSHLE